LDKRKGKYRFSPGRNYTWETNLFGVGSEGLHNLLQWFSKWPYAPAHREPNQISKVPQENDGKLGSYRNFGVGHRKFTA
jgi:hypothetical protein